MAKKKVSAKKGSRKSTGKKAIKAVGGAPDPGSYIDLGGQRLTLGKHPTDFSMIGQTTASHSAMCSHVASMSSGLTRLSAQAPAQIDRLMAEARSDSVAHHIYLVDGTGEEIIIDDRLILDLDLEDDRELDSIIQEFHLVSERRMGTSYVLRVTEATGMNPLKAANSIAQRPSVVACAPQVMVDLQPQQEPALFAEQWYLAADLISHPDLLPDADIQAPEAWMITTGDPSIVVAVIDDGFDLQHPALRDARLHPDRRDFQGGDNDPNATGDDFHGTPVASIAIGPHVSGSAMRGVAPGCTFLPIRIGFGPGSAPIDILDVFRYVSARADVVNCSFGTPPRSFDPFPASFRSEITQLTQSGGRRGKGLVMVFAAANDDAPTFLRAADNLNGVKFTAGGSISEIGAGMSVFSGYPLTPGVVVVSAMTSRKRKSGYSSWGPHVTVTAPSNNLHYITAFVPPGSDPRRNQFIANYRGLGQVGAANRPGHGQPFSPIQRFDDPTTPGLQENFYTRQFGGTSGAAPVVTGIVSLMLSVNSDLTADQVRQILMSTADQNLDPALDLANDPNVQGLTGNFVNGRSLWFGAGKVNALQAVSRANALAGGSGGGGGGGASQQFNGQATPNLEIPDRQPQGVVSHIDITGAGALRAITVDVDISHTWRGDLRVSLISPQGLIAELHRFSGGSSRDLNRTYSANDTQDLENLVNAGIQVQGRWVLHVADHVRRDVGTLNSWSLDLGV